MRRTVLFCAALTLLGCSQRLKYPGLGSIDGATVLGPVETCRGSGCCDGKPAAWSCDWPLALSVPPPEFDVQRSLVAAAAKQYGVPADEIVLGVIELEMTTEVVGTVRGWTARADASRKP